MGLNLNLDIENVIKNFLFGYIYLQNNKTGFLNSKGQKHGVWLEFEFDKLRRKENYKNGNYNGICTWYSKTGSMCHSFYVNGNPVHYNSMERFVNLT